MSRRRFPWIAVALGLAAMAAVILWHVAKNSHK